KENPFQRKATNSSQTVETVNSSNIEILGLTKTIRIRLGLLKGVKKIAFGKPLSAFLGIPYGQPPLNDLRFKHSLPAKRWSGILEARSFGPSCVQSIIRDRKGQECRKLAKLVGCYNETEINFEYLDNSANSTDQDYTSFESDIDVMNCLKRVDTKKIIEAEKEIVLDENRFMAFLPRIIENDSIAVKNPNDAYKNQSNIGEEIKEVLLGVVEDEGGMFLNSIMPLVFGDTVPQNMTVDDAKMYIKKALTWVPDPGPDLVIRLLFDENQPQEKLLKQIINVIGGVTLSCPVVLFGEQFGAFEPERKAYFYNFDYKPSNFTTWPPWFGIGHTSDLFYLFGKPFRNDQKYTEDDIKVAKDVIKIWTTFAKTGKPVLPHNVAGKKWPLYGETHPNYIPINPIKASIKSGPPKNGLCDKLRVSTIL
ncbi:acetylcholinesterase-like protein, partial [Dinothrombium tinctorium]